VKQKLSGICTMNDLISDSTKTFTQQLKTCHCLLSVDHGVRKKDAVHYSSIFHFVDDVMHPLPLSSGRTDVTRTIDVNTFILHLYFLCF